MRKIIQNVAKCLFAVLAMVSVVSAQSFVVESFVMNQANVSGLSSFFNSGTGVQDIYSSSGGRATALVSFSTAEPDAAIYSELTFTATGAVTPSSKETVANSALYNGGSWSIDFYTQPHFSIPGDVKIGTLSGGIDWYSEYDADGLNNEPLGHGVGIGTNFILDLVGGDEWNWPEATSGILTNFGTLGGYDATADWGTTTASVIITTDLSLIPEPATMSLLGLGALAAARRRRKA